MNARARLVGLFATLTTLALVAGVPAALVTFAGNPLPDTTPTLDAVRAALTRPDDGTLLLAVITWIAWIAWAVLALAVLLEVAARLRGLHAPHVPGLGLPQGAAAQLVSAAALLFVVIPPTAATAHATPAQPVPAVTAPVSPAMTTRLPGWTPTAASFDGAPPVQAPVTAEETYTVRSGDSLSRIAATHLGDGDRWRELVDLNPALADNPDLIFAGTVLRLPDATMPQGMREYTVQAGDTLSAIAERAYGDPTLYPFIVQASRHIPQPGGTYLNDPDVIDIGWNLNIPAVALNVPPGQGVVPPVQEIVPPVDNPAAIPPPPQTDTPARPAGGDMDQMGPQGLKGATSPRQLDRSAPETTAPTSSSGPPAGGGSSAEAATDVEGVADVEPEWLVLGLTGAGALLAGSMLATLRSRRRAGVRHRRPGRTLAAPDPVLTPIEKTLTLLGTDTAVTVQHLDQVLRRLAAAQTQAQAPMPELAAVQLTDTTLGLILSEATDLPGPWQGSADRRAWSLAADVPLEEVGPHVEDQLAPWPLLATIGMDEDGARWLLNLENRHLLVTGDHTYGLDLARHLAAEAATNPWSSFVVVDLVGVAPELAGLDPYRIHAHHDTDAGEEAFGSCLVDAVATVDRNRDTGRNPVAARAALDEPDAWPARLLLVDAGTHSQNLDQLLELMREHPAATGTSVVVTAATTPGHGQSSTTLQVTAQGRVEVPDLGLDLIAAGLTEEEARGCAALLAHAEDPIDAPIPDFGEQANGWAAFADQAGALRREHTLPRHSLGRDPRPDPTEMNPEGIGEVAAGSLLPEQDSRYLTVGATTTDDLAVLAPRIPDTVRREVEEADPHLDDDVAMWFHKDSALPKLALLGPVKVTARGEPPARRRPYLAELLTFIAMSPHGATTEEICESFAITRGKVRDSCLTLRKWLGTNPRTGLAHLPNAPDAPGALVRGVPVYQVTDLLVDLDLFRRLRTRGQGRGADGISDLRTALRLVSGRPFDYPINREVHGGWSWLIGGDRHDEHARVAIVDVAHIVTTHALAAGDLPAARWAAETAAAAAPYEEVPRLDLAAVAAAEGDEDTAQRIIRDQIGNRSDDDLPPPEISDRTAQVLLQRHSRTKARAS